MNECEGVLNPSADNVKRNDMTWSEGTLKTWNKGRRTEEFTSDNEPFDRLVCRGCGSKRFEVLRTAEWETSARCVVCGLYYIVHSG